jgi:hypothetical protein
MWAVIEADTAELAEAEAHKLWAENGEHEVFSFKDASIDGIEVEKA